MIHTAKFGVPLSVDDMSMLRYRFKESTSLISKNIDKQYNEIFDTDITKKYGVWYLFTTIDVIRLLNRGIIIENDISTIKKQLDEYLYFVLGENDKEFTLYRIDYRLDVVIWDEAERIVLLKMLKQSLDRYGFKVKDNSYDTTLYYHSKSISICIYDKVIERLDKCREIMPYEKDVLRIEVRLLNNHLNYMKRQYGLSKQFENYFKRDFWQKYMSENILPIFHSGNFYTRKEAKRVIKGSNLKEREKTLARKFLTDVLKHDLNGIKLLKKRSSGKLIDKYSLYQIRENRKRLEFLGINPILVPTEHEVILGSATKIPNPFRF
jgi:hypothetical protein